MSATKPGQGDDAGADQPDWEDFAVPDTAADPRARRRRTWLAVVAVIAVVAMVATSFGFLLWTSTSEPSGPTGSGVDPVPAEMIPEGVAGVPATPEQIEQIRAVTEEFITAYNTADADGVRATLCAEAAELVEPIQTPSSPTVLDGFGHVFVDGDRATARVNLGQSVGVDQTGDVLVIQEVVLEYRDEDGWRLCQ